MTRTKCRRPSCERRSQAGAKGYCQKHAYAHGTLTPFVDAAPTRRIFQHAQTTGHSIETISRATGVSYGTVFRVLHGQSRRVRKITEDRARQFSGDPNMMEAWPLTRRVRSLLAAGLDMSTIATGCGVARETISHLVHAEHQHVLWRVGQAVRDYYAQHWDTPVTTPHPLAVEHGWPVPFAWDDIDDPEETHEAASRGATRDLTEGDWAAIDVIVARYGQSGAARLVGLSAAGIRAMRAGQYQGVRVDAMRRIHELAGEVRAA